MTPRSSNSPKRVKLRPHDPFDLIRLLAQSQSDPRKAVAELVQNSLDAGARHIRITWFNEKGLRAIRIWDDGGGVFPDMEREEALKRIAQTIGHSHKLGLTPVQRREQMVLGRYGIGLIGFWSVGEVLEMRSRVGGDAALVLRMKRDRRSGEVFRSRARLLDEPDTFTEVTIRDVASVAQRKIRPPRLQAYLASELRGQLLEREAQVEIHDRVARGRARKHFLVQPRPYLGLPLEAWRELDVPGFESARVELYLVAPEEERRGVVTLSCGGTVVLDDIALIDGDDAPRELWQTGQLEGVIDFPELHVAPSTRRGFTHDEPVSAFCDALSRFEGAIRARLAEEQARRSEQRQQSLARDIRRAFGSVARQLPEYELFNVRGRSAVGAGPGAAKGVLAGEGLAGRDGIGAEGEVQGVPTGGGLAADAEDLEPDDHAAPPMPAQEALFPPGPLARLVLQPPQLRLAPLASRRLRARALDADLRPAAGEVEYEWHLVGTGDLVSSGARATYTAPERPPEEDHAITIGVIATSGERVASAEAQVRIVGAKKRATIAAGVPEPIGVADPGGGWRSRMHGERWEYNSAHPDCLRASATTAGRLRYLIHLFAKEIVQRNYGSAADSDVLERMVEVLTYLDEGKRRAKSEGEAH
jgi:hypothetical protein